MVIVAEVLRLRSWQVPDQVGGLGWIAEASISEEPSAEKPHAGICAGTAG